MQSGTTPGSTNAVIYGFMPSPVDLTQSAGNGGDPNFATWNTIYDEFKVHKIRIILTPPVGWGQSMYTQAPPSASASLQYSFVPQKTVAVSWFDRDATPSWQTAPANADITDQAFSKYGAKKHNMFKRITRTLYPKYLVQCPAISAGAAFNLDTGRSGWFAGSSGNTAPNAFGGLWMLAVPYLGPDGIVGQGFQPIANWDIRFIWTVTFRQPIYG